MYEPYQLRPYNPDDLYQKKGNYDLFDEMRQDEQIAAVLSLKKFFILNGDWIIKSEDDDVKEFVEYSLKNLTEDRFENYLYNILSALDFGFSLSEKIWARVNVASYGEKIILRSLKTRAPHSFELHTDNYGNISAIKQDQGGVWTEIPYDKFIHYTYQEEFDNPYGQSELNVGIYRAWWSKNALIKMWNVALERFGNPPVVGKYPASLIKEKDNLKNALSNIQTKTAIVIPEEISIELLKGDPKNDAFKQAIDFYNATIARKMLIPDLMGISGDETHGGSYALGQAQFNMFYNNITQERKKLERVINREIINHLVMWNFGGSAYAELCFQSVDYQQRKDDLTIFLQALQTKEFPINLDHINWFYKQVSAPELDEDEYNKMQEEKKAIAEQIRGNNDKQGAQMDNGESKKSDSDGDGDDSDDKGNGKEDKEYVKTYQMRYDAQIDYAQIENTLNDIESIFKRELSKAMRIGINGLIDDIQRKKIIEGKRYEALNKLSLGNMSQIIKAYKDNMGNAHAAGKLSVEREMKFEETAPLGSEEAMEFYDNFVEYMAYTDSEEILKRTKSIILNAIRTGAPAVDTISALREALVDYTADTSASRLERIVRTATSRAYNGARAVYFQQSVDEGRIKGFQFSAVMDGRTSAICASLDGKVFKPNEMSAVTPPLHFNCRSILVALHEDDTVEQYDTLPDFEVDEWGFYKQPKVEDNG